MLAISALSTLCLTEVGRMQRHRFLAFRSNMKGTLGTVHNQETLEEYRRTRGMPQDGWSWLVIRRTFIPASPVRNQPS